MLPDIWYCLNSFNQNVKLRIGGDSNPGIQPWRMSPRGTFIFFSHGGCLHPAPSFFSAMVGDSPPPPSFQPWRVSPRGNFIFFSHGGCLHQAPSFFSAMVGISTRHLHFSHGRCLHPTPSFFQPWRVSPPDTFLFFNLTTLKFKFSVCFIIASIIHVRFNL